MRHAGLLAFALLLGSTRIAAASCGDHRADSGDVASIETAIAAQCNCCEPRAAYRRCVASIIGAAVRQGTLRRACAPNAKQDALVACPVSGAATPPCKVCNADADCAANQFCDCRIGSCTKTGGTCVARPATCPDVVAPVCGCDGTSYPNDCFRRAAGACKLHDGPCLAAEGCFDTIARACTGEVCGPNVPCRLGNEFCTPICAPPATGTCFDILGQRCTNQSCDPGHACLPNAFCVPRCPPPPPTGRCFVTVENQCSTEPCGPGQPCRNPNEFCTPRCLPTTTTTTTLPGGGCTTDADCDDGNFCTVDRCVNGQCEHGCICVEPASGASCCGPGPLCVAPCGTDATGTCGGFCPDPSQVCAASASGCACTPAPPTCGDTFPACNGSCPAGSSCTSLTGAPVCQCVATCEPGTGSFFYTCGDPVCGGHRPHPGVPPCTTEHAGEPCSCLGQECDPADACDRLLVCATSDPTHGGICPISRRAYKEDIQYLDAAEQQRLHDELLKFRLATYRYKTGDASPATHLGFIIDDVGSGPAVAADGDHVDLYGYASMAVAAVQTQAREIAQLRREIEGLKAALNDSRSQDTDAGAVCEASP